MKKISSIYQDTALVLLNILVLVFLMELIIGAIGEPLYRSLKGSTAVSSSLEQAVPSLSRDDIVMLLDETRDINKYEYAPWVQFKIKPYEGTFYTIDQQNIRRDTPVEKNADIVLFGGSTMFGWGVSDHGTIPFFLQEKMGQKQSVENYGQPFYTIAQEAVLFEQLLLSGKRPKKAVFLDGLNDGLQVKSSLQGHPFHTPSLSNFMKNQNEEGGAFKTIVQSILSASSIVRAINVVSGLGVGMKNQFSSYGLPQGITSEEAAQAIFKNYKKTIGHVNSLCGIYNVECYFLWQPVPYYLYQNDNDTLASQLPHHVITPMYKLAKKSPPKNSQFINISYLLDGYKAQAFVDGFHYSEPFNKVIAEKIYAILQ